MRRSKREYPLDGLDLAKGLQQAWENGWMDDFSDEHFLIKAIEGKLNTYPKLFQAASENVCIYRLTPENFHLNFCINFSAKIKGLISLFGEDNIHRFFTDQLSAGKDHYQENQFFRALSEVSVLNFWRMRSSSGDYEPKTNGNKNPEARVVCNNDVIVDIEVKTPGFTDFSSITDIVIPTVLLDEHGRNVFMEYCNSHGLHGAMPRVMKLKDFLNSAAGKFEEVDHISHMNILYINWSLSEFEESGYQEAFSLMANSINGILIHKDIGLSLGIHEDVYNRITAVVTYTEPLQGLMFGDFKWVWTTGRDFQPHFGIIGMHNCKGLFETTGMNPYATQMTPLITGIFHDTKYLPELMSLIERHMLKPQHYSE